MAKKLVHFGHPTWYILGQVYYDTIFNNVICLTYTNKKLNKRGLIKRGQIEIQKYQVQYIELL